MSFPDSLDTLIRDGGVVWGFLSAVLINATARRRRIGADAAIGIITTASFAPRLLIATACRNRCWY